MLLNFVVLCLVGVAINAQNPVNDDVLCEGRLFEPNCTVGTIQIASATYGKTDSWFCAGPTRQPSWSTNCALDVTQNIRTSCQDKQSCSMRVEGADNCVGFAKYLRVIWQCYTPLVQARVNNKNTNILVAASRDHANPVPLHNLNVGGANLYIFVDPPVGIQQVRFYLDSMDKVFTTETITPWDLLGGRPWDTIGSRVADGQHRILAAITFADGTNGYVDATFTVRNGNNNNNNNNNAAANRALEKSAVSFSDNTATTTTVVTENHIVPWSLFGTTMTVIVALSVVIGVMDKKKQHVVEHA